MTSIAAYSLIPPGVGCLDPPSANSCLELASRIRWPALTSSVPDVHPDGPTIVGW